MSGLSGELVERIERLLADVDLRRRLRQEARRTCGRARTSASYAQELVASLRDMLAKPDSSWRDLAPVPFRRLRRELAARYVHGTGIEIGALHEPLEVPPGVSVTYVDRLPLEELRRHYVDLADREFVTPEVVEDGERLASIPDRSLDFVIANHFIEHCQDPIGALESQLRVLKDAGIVFMAVPDKRRTFDRDRPETSIEHLVKDYREGPSWSRWAHFEEYARLVDKAEEPLEQARRLMSSDCSIHFHVWTPKSFRALLHHCREQLRLPFELVALERNDFEFIAILRRTSRIVRRAATTASPG